MEQLTKEQSRKRWRQLRDFWNEWDPIGVSPNNSGPTDEYDSYLGETLRRLESNSSIDELAKYLSWVVGDYMGMGSTGVECSKPIEFAERLHSWFSKSWK